MEQNTIPCWYSRLEYWIFWSGRLLKICDQLLRPCYSTKKGRRGVSCRYADWSRDNIFACLRLPVTILACLNHARLTFSIATSSGILIFHNNLSRQEMHLFSGTFCLSPLYLLCKWRRVQLSRTQRSEGTVHSSPCNTEVMQRVLVNTLQLDGLNVHCVNAHCTTSEIEWAMHFQSSKMH